MRKHATGVRLEHPRQLGRYSVMKNNTLGIVENERGQKQPADKKRAQQPAAGPHSKPELTDDHKTPGAGTLPKPGTDEDSTSG